MAIVLSGVLIMLAGVALDALKNQGQKLSIIMANLQDFKDLLSRVDVATNNIAEDLKRLAAQIEAGGLSAKDEFEISEALKLAAEKLEAVAAVNPEPPVVE